MSDLLPLPAKPIRFNLWSVDRIRQGIKFETRRLPKGDKFRYEVGDLLWVRESFCIVPKWITNLTFPDTTISPDGREICFYEAGCLKLGRWRPNFYMPRWACRTYLRVTQCRKEPLQNMDELDARGEGAKDLAEYREVWDSINGKKPGCRWADNPVVEVIRFEVVS